MSKGIIYHNRMQFTKRGDELIPETLEPNKIYAVNYRLKDKTAQELGTYAEQWGIIILDKDMKITRSYNVVEHGVYSTEPGVLNKTLHVFLPTGLEELAISSVMAAHHQSMQVNDLRFDVMKLENELARLRNTWYCRIAAMIKNMFH